MYMSEVMQSRLARRVGADRVAVRASGGLRRFFGVPLRLVAAIVGAGVAGGALGAAYLRVLREVDRIAGPDGWRPLTHGAVLVAVGVAVAVLVRVAGRPADVELLVDNIHLPEPRTERSNARLRSLLPVSLLCIGAGGPLGPEAPVVTMTGTVAHRIAWRLRLGPADVRIVTIAGMAAGFTVLFGAPLGATLFALEIPHRRGMQYYEAVVPAAIGAALGFAVFTAVNRTGLEPVWHFPAVAALRWPDLLWAVVAGALGALIAATFTFVTTVLERVAGLVPAIVRPAVGGVALGALALWSANALTNGEHQIDALDGLGGRVAVATLVAAGCAKLLAAAIGVASGWRGGFIIPLFFVGFCFARVVAGSLPGASEWAFVAGTMVAANVGVTKTPLGSTLVVTEMAGSALLPSTLIAALTSLVLTSPLGLIHAQRERVDVYRSGSDA